MKSKHLLFLLFFLLSYVLNSSAVYAVQEQAFTIGTISTKPKKRIKNSTPLAHYVTSHLQEYGFTKGQVVVSDNVEEMAQMLQSGEVTMLSTTPYAALLIEQKSDAKIAALRWKQGVEQYHSVIYARKDSPVKKITDLQGRTIIFEKNTSTSGFFLPAVFLLKQGYQLQKMDSFKGKPDGNKIGYLFIDEHLHKSNEINMSIAVFHKRADAAAFSNLDWKDPDTTPINAKKQMHIIAETASYPRGVILFSPTLSEQQKQALLATLFAAEKDEKGTQAMQLYQKTTRFSKISESMQQLLEQAKLQMHTNPTLF